MESNKTNFNKLTMGIQSVLAIVDEHHKPTVRIQLDNVTEEFNALRFNARSYVVQSWLKDKETRLDNTTRVNIVLPVHVSLMPCIPSST